MSPEPDTIIDDFLRRQQTLTAVDRFAVQHTSGGIPANARYYRDLIPSRLPEQDEQFSFEVNLDSCSGCKACVTACHNLNGLDDGESWRDVGLLVSLDHERSVQQSVTTGCHHCVDPGCLSGCPVLAYEKDAVTGIVRHLDDQCIGCQYCVLKCPYEVPQYSARRGIVRKCDMCSSRLEAGEAPACVQACPNGAITIRIVNQKNVFARAAEGIFLPDAPDPILTIPTTRYLGKFANAQGLVSADHGKVRSAPWHWPLAVMLVLTQMAVGLFGVAEGWQLFDLRGSRPLARNLSIGAMSALLVGLGFSVLHLGRPSGAWRSWLGWRTSWLSREVIAFGVLAGAGCVDAIILQFPARFGFFMAPAAGALACAAGLAAVFCSVMVYHDTGRKFWNIRPTAIRFFGSALVLGPAGAVCLGAMAGMGDVVKVMSILFLVASVAKWFWEARFFRSESEEAEIRRSVILLAGALREWVDLRFTTGLLSAILLLTALHIDASVWVLTGAILLGVIGELFERLLFFQAVAPERMPGGH